MADSKLSSTVERVSDEELMDRLGGPLRLRVINPVTGEVIPNWKFALPEDTISPLAILVYHGLRHFGQVCRGRIPTWNIFKILIDDVPIASWADLFSTWGVEPTRTVGLVFMEDPPFEDRVRWEDLSPDDLPLHLQPCVADPSAFFAANGYTLLKQNGNKSWENWYVKSS